MWDGMNRGKQKRAKTIRIRKNDAEHVNVDRFGFSSGEESWK